MKLTLYNLSAANNAFEEIKSIIESGKAVNIEYDVAKKPKTKSQQGFIFGAIISQIQAYFQNAGFNVDEDDIMLMMYDKVSAILPEMVRDRSGICRFSRDYIMTLSKMDRELTSKFIDGIFTVIGTDPLFSGLQMSPDVYFNWVFHITEDDLIAVSKMQLPERDPDYLEYVRTLPCLVCGLQHRSEAHHAKVGQNIAVAMKTEDFRAIPLCHRCHLGIAHQEGNAELERRLGFITSRFSLEEFTKLCYCRWKTGLGIHKTESLN